MSENRKILKCDWLRDSGICVQVRERKSAGSIRGQRLRAIGKYTSRPYGQFDVVKPLKRDATAERRRESVYRFSGEWSNKLGRTAVSKFRWPAPGMEKLSETGRAVFQNRSWTFFGFCIGKTENINCRSRRTHPVDLWPRRDGLWAGYKLPVQRCRGGANGSPTINMSVRNRRPATAAHAYPGRSSERDCVVYNESAP